MRVRTIVLSIVLPLAVTAALVVARSESSHARPSGQRLFGLHVLHAPRVPRYLVREFPGSNRGFQRASTMRAIS